MNTTALTKSTVIGTILQLAMVLSGHSIPAIALLFAPIGMGISLVAGLLYAKMAGAGTTGSHTVGGLAAGGICALLGIAVSCLLGDVTAIILALGTASSAVTGAIGGVVGHFVFGSKAAATA